MAEDVLSLRCCLLVVSVAAFMCFSNTISAGFVYDDIRAILKNKDVQDDNTWFNLFYNDFWGTPILHSGSHKSYRPLCVLSFRLNYILEDFNPRGYHLFNVILHAIVSCIFTVFCHILYKDNLLALFGGVLFAVHPVHAEAVAGVVGRADVGAAFFFLAALIAYHKCSSEFQPTCRVWFAVSLFCSLCALFTKEQGITVLGVGVVYELLVVSKCNVFLLSQTLDKLRASGGLQRCFVLISWFVFIFTLRFAIMGASTPQFSDADNPVTNNPHILTRFMTFLYLPVRNICLFIYPWQLSYDWSEFSIPLVEKVFCFENLCSLFLYALLLLILLKYFAYLKRSERLKVNMESDLRCETMNLMVFGFSVMILSFLPATNLFFYVGFYMAERILYIPSIGFCLLVVNGMKIIKTQKKHTNLLLCTTVCMLGLFAWRTYTRNFVWKDGESLYRSGLKTSPAKSYSNLANVLFGQNKFEEAEQAYELSLQYRSNSADAYYNLGHVLQSQKKYDKALRSYKQAILYRPRLAAAHLNLAVVLRELKRDGEALQVLRNASNISDHGLKDPYSHATSLTHIRYTIGQILFAYEKHEEALKTFKEAIEKMPKGYEAQSIYNMIGQCYTTLKNNEKAGKWYLKALQTNENHVPALLTYAKHLFNSRINSQEMRQAVELFEKAIKLDPNRTESYEVYGASLRVRGNFAGALRVYERQLFINSSDPFTLSDISAMHRELKNFDKALEFQKQASEVDPHNFNVLTNLGALYHLVGNLQDAKETYTHALKLQPTNELLHENMKRLGRLMEKH